MGLHPVFQLLRYETDAGPVIMIVLVCRFCPSVERPHSPHMCRPRVWDFKKAEAGSSYPIYSLRPNFLSRKISYQILHPETTGGKLAYCGEEQFQSPQNHADQLDTPKMPETRWIQLCLVGLGNRVLLGMLYCSLHNPKKETITSYLWSWATQSHISED